MTPRYFAVLRRCAVVLGLVLGGHGDVDGQTQASVVGTVTDETKAVLPGVTITATDLATGRQFVGVTDERGEYRLVGMAPGRYKAQAELPGFAISIIDNFELLVGQNATVTFTLKVGALAETTTVVGEAPLIDTRSTQVAGNIDRRQMEELPISGRNWMELSMLVKGITANDVGKGMPGGARDGEFQLNLDGQQISQAVSWTSIFGQPGLSREAIAEYQIVTNLFDVTQGRSAGLQVQAISRGGNNNLSGSVYGYFRDSKFNAADFIAKQVLPYSNQQVGASVGGPIIQNKLFYFTTFEHEAQPNTVVVQPAIYTRSIGLDTEVKHRRFLARVDYAASTKDQISARFTNYYASEPRGELFSNTYPTFASNDPRDNNATMVTWSRVLSSNKVQEVKFSYFGYHWDHWPADGVPLTPQYVFPGLTVGARSNYPEEFWQKTPSIRYDLSWHKGTHDVKIGGEFLKWRDTGWWMNRERGVMYFGADPPDLATRFPLDAWNDASRWDLTGLDSLALRYERFFAPTGFGTQGKCPIQGGCGNWGLNIPRPSYAVWFGDTWAISDRLTANYGIRYDLDWSAMAPPGVTAVDIPIDNGFERRNIGYRNDLRDLNNVSPRGGISYNVTGNGDLVIRAGTGLYYSVPVSELPFTQQLFNGQRVLANAFINDNLPGFVQNPTRGITGDDVFAGRVPLPPQNPTVIAHDYQFPYTWQSTVGVQRQLGPVTAVDADLTYYRGYHMGQHYDPNLFYDPVTGYNKHPNVFGRPYPQYGSVLMFKSDGKSDNLALASQFTRRYRDNYQFGITYTLMLFRHNTGTSDGGFYGGTDNNFCVSCEWGRANDFQRSTFRANGVYNPGWGITLAGSYFFGSGNYYAVTYPWNPFSVGGRRLRPDGSTIERNSLKGDSLNKLDLRVSKEIRLVGDVKLTGIAELFNVFNHANYGAYNGVEATATYGQPRQNLANTYLPRSGQLAFKLSF
jgi:Carboxypeptidase regulatory-like domain